MATRGLNLAFNDWEEIKAYTTGIVGEAQAQTLITQAETEADISQRVIQFEHNNCEYTLRPKSYYPGL